MHTLSGCVGCCIIITTSLQLWGMCFAGWDWQASPTPLQHPNRDHFMEVAWQQLELQAWQLSRWGGKLRSKVERLGIGSDYAVGVGCGWGAAWDQPQVAGRLVRVKQAGDTLGTPWSYIRVVVS
jgi:hypothetical protein